MAKAKVRGLDVSLIRAVGAVRSGLINSLDIEYNPMTPEAIIQLDEALQDFEGAFYCSEQGSLLKKLARKRGTIKFDASDLNAW